MIVTSDLIARLARALRRGIEAHGAPNGFGPGELHDEYGGPRAHETGYLMRHARTEVERELGHALTYQVGRPCTISVSES